MKGICLDFRSAREFGLYPDLYQKCNVSFPNPRFFNFDDPDAFTTGDQTINWQLHAWLSLSLFFRWRLAGLARIPAPGQVFFQLGGLVGFSRVYLGDHYPGDVLSGALSGMALAESVQRVQAVVLNKTVYELVH
jgi:hypothetical protein